MQRKLAYVRTFVRTISCVRTHITDTRHTTYDTQSVQVVCPTQLLSQCIGQTINSQYPVILILSILLWHVPRHSHNSINNNTDIKYTHSFRGSGNQLLLNTEMKSSAMLSKICLVFYVLLHLCGNTRVINAFLVTRMSYKKFLLVLLVLQLITIINIIAIKEFLTINNNMTEWGATTVPAVSSPCQRHHCQAGCIDNS